MIPFCLDCNERVGSDGLPRSARNPQLCDMCADLEEAFVESLRLAPAPADVLDSRHIVIDTPHGSRTVALVVGGQWIGDEETGRARPDPARDTRAMLFANVHKNAAKLRRLRRGLKSLALASNAHVNVADDPERALAYLAHMLEQLGMKVIEQQKTILAASPARSVTP